MINRDDRDDGLGFGAGGKEDVLSGGSTGGVYICLVAQTIFFV